MIGRGGCALRDRATGALCCSTSATVTGGGIVSSLGETDTTGIVAFRINSVAISAMGMVGGAFRLEGEAGKPVASGERSTALAGRLGGFCGSVNAETEPVNCGGGGFSVVDTSSTSVSAVPVLEEEEGLSADLSGEAGSELLLLAGGVTILALGGLDLGEESLSSSVDWLLEVGRVSAFILEIDELCRCFSILAISSLCSRRSRLMRILLCE